MDESGHLVCFRRTFAVGVVLLLAMSAILVAPAGLALAQGVPQPVTVQLNEVNDSNISGAATLTAEGPQTNVDMRLMGSGLTGNHPTHIHTGTCANFDPNPLYPLETVVLQSVDHTGRSVSTVDVSLGELQSGNYVILVHLSPEALTTYLVCGEIPTSGTPQQAGGAVSGIPAAGSGSALRASGAPLVLLLLAGLSGGGALAFNRRGRASST